VMNLKPEVILEAWQRSPILFPRRPDGICVDTISSPDSVFITVQKYELYQAQN